MRPDTNARPKWPEFSRRDITLLPALPTNTDLQGRRVASALPAQELVARHEHTNSGQSIGLLAGCGAASVDWLGLQVRSPIWSGIFNR